MSQPKLPDDLARMLHQAGLSASLYQPTHLFVKNGRKLPNVPEPGDPWECFLRRDGSFGVVVTGVGATVRDAVESAFLKLLKPKGLLVTVKELEQELHRLTGVLHASQG